MIPVFKLENGTHIPATDVIKISHSIATKKTIAWVNSKDKLGRDFKKMVVIKEVY